MLMKRFMMKRLFTLAALLQLSMILGSGCDLKEILAPVIDGGFKGSTSTDSLDVANLTVEELRNIPDILTDIDISQIQKNNDQNPVLASISDPQFTDIATTDQLLDGSALGILVSVNDEHRYYPFQEIIPYKIVSDTIEDVPIMVTYCPRCRLGIVYRRDINGQIVEFEATNKSYNDNFLMFNRNGGPISLWSQAHGKAIVGDLKGQTLDIFPSEHLTWDEIKARYADNDLKVLFVDKASNNTFTCENE